MDFVILLFIFFVGGGWLIGKSFGDAFFSDSPNSVSFRSPKRTKTTIHNHITNNHLHISEEALKSLVERKNK